MIRCPHWSRLLEHRFDPQVEEPEDWAESLEHLEGCEACRVEAFGTDPTLALFDLPPIEVSADEIRRVEQAVMTLRQGLAIANQDSQSAMEPATGSQRSKRFGVGRGSVAQWRVAAAVALTLGLGLAGLSGNGAFDGFAPMSQDELKQDETTAHLSQGPESRMDRESPAPEGREAGMMPAAWQAAPIVEEVGSPAARVYSYPQEEADTMTLVMIIDPEIEV